MLYRHYLDAKPIAMQGIGLKGVKKRILVGPLTGAPNFVIRIFTVEKNGYTPHHSHPYEHGIVILEGKGKALMDDKELEIGAGCACTIAPNVPHQIVNNSDSDLVFICVVPAGADSDAIRNKS